MGSMKLPFILLITIFSFSSTTVVQKYVRLNSGRDCPMVGLGTGGFSQEDRPNSDQIRQMVRYAIKNGYRHIDTGGAYGNIRVVGQTINKLINEGVVRREDLFITTKIFPSFNKGSKGRYRTLKSVRLSLQKINTTYVDLMLIHFATTDPSINTNIWFALEEALSLKIVRSIGVSNYNTTDLRRLIKRAKVVPAMVQMESHPIRNQRKLIDFCNKYGIRVTTYSPLGYGPYPLMTDPSIVEIGERYNKTVAQVMIRWQIQRGVVVIPKSAKKEGIHENIDVFDFELTNEEMKTLEDKNEIIGYL